MSAAMTLTVVTPDRILFEAQAEAIQAEGPDGCFGLLPRHQDIVAALVPGVIAVRCADGVERFIGLDEGVLVKAGSDVRVATRRGAVGEKLEEMRRRVETVFLALDDQERASRTAVTRLELGVARKVMELRDHGGEHL